MFNLLQQFERLTQSKMKPYASSVRKIENATFFMTRDDCSKYLVVIGKRGICERFEGQKMGEIEQGDVLLCPMSSKNCETLMEFLSSLKPTICTMKLSFGFGDRLGVATAAHAQCVNKEKCFPVFAQQSVREITRTERTWTDVLHSAIWGVFESGYDGPFGADADHVKRIEDLENAARVGYTMFTIDPSDHIKDPSRFDRKELARFYEEHPLRRALETRYVGKSFTILGERLTFDEEKFAELFVTYIDAIDHVEKCYKALRAATGRSFDLEVSIDETALPTTPLAHIFFVQELMRRGVEFQTLAPRFPGEWQKGIDYIGDIELFAEELDKHFAIVKMFTGYRLSLHSGSDKFSVYSILAEKTEERST